MSQASTSYKINENVIGSVSRLKKVAITSGKGGVGKTNVVVNLGVALSGMGMKVAILDADYGLGNIDILLGIEPPMDLSDLLKDTAVLEEIIVEKNGLKIIPAGSGVQSLTQLSEYQEILLYKELKKLEKQVDLLIIDTAAGISDNVISLLLAADEVVLVVSPDNTSIVDAYAVVKVVSELDTFKNFAVIANMVRDEEEGADVFLKFSRAAKKFLDKEIQYLGYVQRDENLLTAMKYQEPVVEKFPGTACSKNFLELAGELKRRVEQMEAAPTQKFRLDF
ncbi:MAG: MinD/ParA family protein [Acidobacteria bacterium]|jgi:flagellar biosynthesis protein FlhG|nr:MinD/ParA family protein [Acidobacteriota bacterium]